MRSQTETYTRRPGELLHPERESEQQLDGAKANPGSFKFSAQYQQDPLPIEGNLVKWEWFQY